MTTADSLSTRFADLSVAAEFSSLPEITRQAARLHWLDGLGVTAGGYASEAGAVARRYLAKVTGSGAERDVLLPGRDGSRPDDDAFLFGTYAFSENYGDTSLRSVAHPNTVVVPALLAAARSRVVTGERLLAALVVGYQVMEFLARSLNNGSPRMGHQIRGFRPSASAGAVGAAAAVAHAWGLPAATTQTAIEIACNYGGGLRRHAPGPASSIRVHSGESARGGVTAVMLALSGLEGEAGMIEGDGGFLRAYMADAVDSGAEDYLGPDTWAVGDVAFKLHSTAHTLHTALDCLLDLCEEGLEAESIEQMEIRIPDQHATISAATPYTSPTTAAAAGGSYPFCAGVATVTGDYLWPEQLAGHLGHAEVERIAAATRVVVDSEQSAIFDRDPGTWPATVEVRASGRTWQRGRREPRGLHIDEQLEQDLIRKFVRLASRISSEDQAVSLASSALDIESAPDAFAVLASSTGG
ncbi:MAG: MmgE/PrpD family protein [Acidobacteriota bacterium]|nr:MmgE/PrpD family protein [Acidobacteriota bacterium]